MSLTYIPLRPFTRSTLKCVVVLTLALLTTTAAYAEVRVANVFGDQMVLPRDAPVPVWGWAEAGESITVEFDEQRKSTTSDAQGKWILALPPWRPPQKGFAVAGSDRRFIAAEARLEGNEVIVSSEDVPKPVAVRYAWVNAPLVSLYDRAGTPLAPFRTDDWKP